MNRYRVYGVSLNVGGVTKQYNITSKNEIRKIFSSITEPIEDFTVTEEIGTNRRELGFTEISRILSPNYS